MDKKPLNDEEVAELCSSPYVSIATPERILFTEEFNRISLGLLSVGEQMEDILKYHGINPDILGTARIHTYALGLRKSEGCRKSSGAFQMQKQKKTAAENEEQNPEMVLKRIERAVDDVRLEMMKLENLLAELKDCIQNGAIHGGSDS